MRLPILALAGLLASGCAGRIIHVTPSAQPVTVIQAPAPVAHIQFHYVYINTTWVRRSGPPPAGVRYHQHPRHRNTVIVHRSTSSRPTVRHSTPVRRSTAHRHSKNCRHNTHRSTRRR